HDVPGRVDEPVETHWARGGGHVVVDLYDEGVVGEGVASAVVQGRIQHRAGGRAAGGEISRIRVARDIGRARGIHRDAAATVVAVVCVPTAPAQVGGVDERRASRVELGHEGVSFAAAVRGLQGIHSGKVGGTSEPR